MVERGHAHAGHGGELLNPQGLGVVRPEPLNCLGGAMALLAQRGDGAEMLSLRTAQQAKDDFALDEAAEKGNVLRRVKKVDKAGTGVEEFD